MKLNKLMLCLAVLCAPLAVTAQMAEIEEFPQGKVVARTYEPHFIGSDGNHVWMVELTGRMKNKPELVCYNMEQKELSRVQLTDDKETKCYGGYLNNGKLDLLMAQWEGDNMKVYRERRDPVTLQSDGEPLVLADYKGTKGDKMAFAIASSANQQLLAGVYIIGREGQTTELQVALYSRELEEYWKMDTRCRKLDFFHVTDSGEVVLGGRSGSTYTFNILDGEEEQQCTFESDIRAAEVQLARYAGGRLYLVASHIARERYELGVMVDYIAMLCYDTKARELSMEKHDITQLEHNRLYNLKDNAKVKKNDCRVQYMNLVQTMPDVDGCYVMFDQMWRTLVDGVPTTMQRLGMLVARVGDDGRFEWVRTFRISQTSSWNARAMVDYRWVRTAKGPMLVWTEAFSAKELPEEKPIKDFKQNNSKGMLTALRMDRDGDMTRQHFPLGAKQGLLGAPHQLDNGDYLLLLRGVSRGYYAKMKMKE